MKVKPDQELYMTEYVAILMVFTLHGFYTWIDLNRSQSGVTQLNDKTLVYYHKTNCYGHHPTFQGLGTSSRERSSRDYEASLPTWGSCG